MTTMAPLPMNHLAGPAWDIYQQQQQHQLQTYPVFNEAHNQAQLAQMAALANTNAALLQQQQQQQQQQQHMAMSMPMPMPMQQPSLNVQTQFPNGLDANTFASSNGVSPAMSQISIPGSSPVSQMPNNADPNGFFPGVANFAGANGEADHQVVHDDYTMNGNMNMSQAGFMPQQAGLQQGQQVWTRTVYVGNLPADASVDELLSLVRFGPIESVKILPEKSCAFIAFLDPLIAAAFHSDVHMRRTQLHGLELKVGWGKPSPIPTPVLMAVQQHSASRNVYVGGLDQNTTEQSLRDDLSRFGPIDQVKIVRDKNIGFIHFLSIQTAMKVVESLPREANWQGKRVSYGKDRCAYVPKNMHAQQQHNLQASAMAAAYTGNMGAIGANLNPALMNSVLSQNGMDNSILSQAGNRCIYLGNLHPDTTVEEICNAIRGGVLQQIKYIPDKHICFVTFVDPNAALAFFTSTAEQGISIHNRRLKIGWGKASGPTPPGIAMCVQSGGSRNVYLGGIENAETFTEEKIRGDFGQYGEIEMVNILREKNCGFVNFTSISNAIKCIEGIKHNPDYAQLKLAFGKDRCANAQNGRGFFSQRRRVQPNYTSQPNTNGHVNGNVNGTGNSSDTDKPEGAASD